jgi:hypothetical protein
MLFIDDTKSDQVPSGTIANIERNLHTAASSVKRILTTHEMLIVQEVGTCCNRIVFLRPRT